jgi:hypothetical protein
MITEVYDALREVGVSEKKRGVPPRRWQSKSRRLTSIETRLGTLDSRLTGVEAGSISCNGRLALSLRCRLPPSSSYLSTDLHGPARPPRTPSPHSTARRRWMPGSSQIKSDHDEFFGAVYHVNEPEHQ